jgi:predicted MFS family arabinose efflux permease
VIRRYVDIMRAPHAARLMASTSIFSLAWNGTFLPLVFFARDATGSFAGASAVLGADALGQALGGPVRGRLVDRHGPVHTMPVFVVGMLAAVTGMLIAGNHTGSLFLLAPLGFCVGLVGQAPGVVLRAAWPRITEGHERSTSFALLTVMYEVMNLAGPLTGALLLLVASPTAAVAAGAGLAACAAVWFARSPGLDDGERSEPRSIFSAGPLVSPGFRAALLIAFFYGVLFGQLEDIVLPAFAVEHGSKSSGGILLAAVAVGIGVGGFGYGLRQWRETPGRLMPLLSVVALVGAVPALAADSIVTMTLLMLVFGLALAPISTVQFAVIDDVSPPGSGTEAFSWLISVATAGAGAGAVVAGKLVDAHSARTGMLGVVVAAALCAAFALLSRRVLGAPFSAERTREPTAA